MKDPRIKIYNVPDNVLAISIDDLDEMISSCDTYAEVQKNMNALRDVCVELEDLKLEMEGGECE